MKKIQRIFVLESQETKIASLAEIRKTMKVLCLQKLRDLIGSYLVFLLISREKVELDSTCSREQLDRKTFLREREKSQLRMLT